MTLIYPPESVLRAMAQASMEIGGEGPIVERVIDQAFKTLITHLPDSYWSETRAPTTGPSIPLYDALDDCGQAIVDLVLPFLYDTELIEGGLLYELRKQIFENEAHMNGLSMYERRKRAVPAPQEKDEPPRELTYLYFKDTPFLEFFNAQVPFRIPRDRWATHAIILAPSEWGKSELTGLYLREAMEDPEPRAIILLDPHGDLMKKAIPRVPPERLVVIDPDTNPPDLNILDYGVLSDRAALDTFKFLMSSLAGGLSPKQETCINPLFALLRTIDGANLVTLHDIITENARSAAKSSYAEPISRLDDIPRKFFENLWYTGNFSETRDALQWKLSAALSEPAFKTMFSAKRNSIDIARFIEERKVVLVKGGETALGKEGMRLFLLFLVGQYYAAGKRRDAIPEHKRHLAMMFVDEASNVLQSPIIADILIELRKYQCAFIASTQLWAHIAQDVRPAVLGSTGMRIVGKLGHDETMVLARDMETSPETIKGLKNVPRSHAEWCYYVRSVTPSAVVVKAPYGVLEGMPKQKAPAMRPSRSPPEASEPVPAPPQAHSQQQNELSLRDTKLPLPSAAEPIKPMPRVDLSLPKPPPKRDESDKPEQDAPVIAPGKDW